MYCQCTAPVPQYATYAVPNSDDIGGSYIITKDNSTKTCGEMIDGTCGALDSEACIQAKIAAMSECGRDAVWGLHALLCGRMWGMAPSRFLGFVCLDAPQTCA